MKFTAGACGKVARIEGEMRTLLDATAFAGSRSGSDGQAGKDSRFFFPTDDKGRADALAEYTQLNQ